MPRDSAPVVATVVLLIVTGPADLICMASACPPAVVIEPLVRVTPPVPLLKPCRSIPREYWPFVPMLPLAIEIAPIPGETRIAVAKASVVRTTLLVTFTAALLAST